MGVTGIALAVLISGRGSNLQALIDACARDDFPARIAVVVSNRPEVAGLDRARRAGIPALTVDHKAYPTREAFDDALRAGLPALRFVVLAVPEPVVRRRLDHRAGHFLSLIHI